MINYKNELSELVQNIGYLAKHIQYRTLEEENGFTVLVVITLNKDIEVRAEGSASTKKEAQMRAAKNALADLETNYPILSVNWDKVNVEAQKGDVLIKLYAYLKDSLGSRGEKSLFLQRNESNANLADIFDKLQQQQHPDVTIFGDNLGWKHKADWIEALIWKQFNEDDIATLLEAKIKKIETFLDT